MPPAGAATSRPRFAKSADRLRGLLGLAGSLCERERRVFVRKRRGRLSGPARPCGSRCRASLASGESRESFCRLNESQREFERDKSKGEEPTRDPLELMRRVGGLHLARWLLSAQTGC